MILIYFATSLYFINQNWRNAGNISKDIVADMIEISRKSDKMFAMNLPRSLNGAYISGNIQDAVTLVGGDRATRDIIVVSYYEIYRRDEQVTVAKKGMYTRSNWKDRFSLYREVALARYEDARPRAVTMSWAAAHWPMSCRLIAAAISSGKRSGVQANDGTPRLASSAATL